LKSRRKGLDTLFFSNILSLAWALLLPAKSSKGRLYNHLKTMEFKEEVLLEDDSDLDEDEDDDLGLGEDTESGDDAVEEETKEKDEDTDAF